MADFDLPENVAGRSDGEQPSDDNAADDSRRSAPNRATHSIFLEEDFYGLDHFYASSTVSVANFYGRNCGDRKP